MSQSADLRPAFDVARARFAEAGLPLPPVPDDLAPSLRMYSDWIFTTRSDVPAPYGFDWYVEECLAGEVTRPYCVFGHDGHGLNSAAIHFYLVRGPLALFMQIPWGGVYTGTPVDAQQVRYHFEQAANLIATLDDAQSRGKLPLGEQFFVQIGAYTPARWGRKSQRYRWHTEEPPFFVLLDALDAADKLQKTD